MTAPLRQLVPALLAALLGVSLAHAAGDNDNNALQQKLTRFGYEPGAVVDKVEDYRVDGWNYLDDTHIMIYAGPSRRYLISLMTTCYDLSRAENIGFSTTAHQLTKFDKLVVRGTANMKQDCPITEIRELIPTKNKS